MCSADFVMNRLNAYSHRHRNKKLIVIIEMRLHILVPMYFAKNSIIQCSWSDDPIKFPMELSNYQKNLVIVRLDDSI